MKSRKKKSEITLNNWHWPWITFNSHFIVSTAVYPAGIKEYWNIQNLTASTEVQNLSSFYWAKQVVMSLKLIRVLSDRQPKVQSIIFQSCISTPETCESLSHLTHWYPSILACYIIWTQIFFIHMITMNCWASYIIFGSWITQFNAAIPTNVPISGPETVFCSFSQKGKSCICCFHLNLGYKIHGCN